MQIGKHKVVAIDYTLSDGDGKILDTSKGREPLSYIHGTGSIIPGLETALDGKLPAESLSVSIPPEQAYGLRDDSLMEVVPRNLFDAAETLQVGMRFQAPTNEGPRLLTIVGTLDCSWG